MFNVSDIFLENELAGYENVFQVGDINLKTLISSLNVTTISTVNSMRNYVQQVTDAVAEIKRLEEADRIAAEQAAKEAEEQEKRNKWDEVLSAGSDAYNNAVNSGTDLAGAAGASIGAMISELLDD